MSPPSSRRFGLLVLFILVPDEPRLKQLSSHCLEPCFYFTMCGLPLDDEPPEDLPRHSHARIPRPPCRCQPTAHPVSFLFVSLLLPVRAAQAHATSSASQSPAPHSSPASPRSSNLTYRPPGMHSVRSTWTASAVRCAYPRRRLMGHRRMGRTSGMTSFISLRHI
jgi:hypothetical protein